MREHGVVRSAAGLGPFGHLGWAYDDHREFRQRAAEYLLEGPPLNQRCFLVAEGSAESLRAELAGWDGLREPIRSGQIEVLPTAEFFAVRTTADVVDPQKVIAGLAAVLDQTLSAGYAGVRAAVDVTPMVRTGRQRDAFACMEHVADQAVITHPLAVMCAYDRARLGGPAAEFACLHPFVNTDVVGFQLYADPGASFALAGELDHGCTEVLEIALRRIGRLMTGSHIVIDARAVEFIDHRSLLLLAAAGENTTVTLRHAPTVAVVVARHLELPNLRVQVAE